MRRHASFDPDQAPRHVGEPSCDPAARNLLPQNDCPLVVKADQMQGVLACIDPNGSCHCSGCLLGHGDVLLVLLSPSSFSERFGAGARPVHPILGHWAIGHRLIFLLNSYLISRPRCVLSEEHVERRLAAILAADIAGYSRLMGANE